MAALLLCLTMQIGVIWLMEEVRGWLARAQVAGFPHHTWFQLYLDQVFSPRAVPGSEPEVLQLPGVGLPHFKSR